MQHGLETKTRLIGTGTFFQRCRFRLQKTIHESFRVKWPGRTVVLDDNWITFGWEELEEVPHERERRAWSQSLETFLRV